MSKFPNFLFSIRLNISIFSDKIINKLDYKNKSRIIDNKMV